MSRYVFSPARQPALPIVGTQALFPVHRIFCVGRNYADHAREMGNEVDREAPFYFIKSAHHLAEATGSLPLPPRTQNYHHEIELVAVLGAGGRDIPQDSALGCVWGYSVGLDMTRRDLQQASKDKRRSWDTGKDFEFGALSAPLVPATPAFDPQRGGITLRVNGELRQSGDLSDQIWSLPEIIADLSTLYELQPGDMIMTGTPAGVGAVVVGDRLQGEIEGLAKFDFTLG